jgi:diguanylate cyclase (GGDEF)-like protein
MATPLHVLIVEDSIDDAALLLHELRRGGYEPTHQRVDTAESLEQAFATDTFDIVLVDFTMPRFSGRKALEMVKARDADVPFIFVSGTIGEDAAVAAMKSGANDYVMKGNYKRLLPAIDRELREVQERRERRRAEENLRLVQDVAIAVAEAPDVHAALAAALRRMCQTAGCEAGQAWLPTPGGEALECSTAWFGIGPEVEHLRRVSESLKLGPGVGLAGRVWQAKRPVWLDQLVPDEQWPLSHVLHDAGFSMAFGFPVIAAGQVIAVLELFLRAAQTQRERTEHTFSAMAAQLGSVIQRKHAEARLSYLAHYDVLTGLPNRMLFSDRLRQALVDAQRHGRLAGVAHVDVDRFKAINDTLGHDSGDALLNNVAQRLCECVRKGDTVARLSGDEFTLIFSDMRTADDASRIAGKVLETFGAPFYIAGQEIYLSASIGIALFPLDDRTPDGLMRDAHVAMCRAKEGGGNSYQFYRTEMTYRVAERMALENGLRRAIERKELRLNYQPKIDLRRHTVTGVEALVRWHPERRIVVLPEKFVPLAEEVGLIIPIGEWVLDAACAQARMWQDAGLPIVRMAVNLSARQLIRPQLARSVARTLEAHRLEASRLELEITESLLMHNARDAVAMLDELKELGVRLVLDDFGTGYSSLSYLKQLPVHALKVDQSFVQGVPNNPHDCAIATAMIVLAHNLGLTVVAEGVETREQLEFLRERGCDEVQGFLFGTPFVAEDATQALASSDLMS